MSLSQPIKILIALIFVTVVLTFDQLTTSTEPKHIEEPKVAKTVDTKQLTCMAKNIFYEAGSHNFILVI